jgi:hypothetical protein
MNKRTVILSAVILLSLFCSLALAQQSASDNQDSFVQKPKQAPKSPKPPKPPVAVVNDSEEGSEPLQASMKLERGGKLTISNRFGLISVSGYDGDTVEAKAINEDGGGFDSKIPLIKGDSSRMRIALEGVIVRRHSREVHFQIKVPRYAAIEISDAQESDVEIENIDGAVTLVNGSGDARLNNIGSLNADWKRGDIVVKGIKGRCSARIFAGEVSIEDVAGMVDVSAISGDLHVTNAGADVKVNSVSGEVFLHCIKGRVNAQSVSGSIEMINVKGDVDSETVSGENIFTGQIRADGTYRMKSNSGEVVMNVVGEAPGFTITMTTFNGEIETGFPIKVDSAIQQNEFNRRIVGRYGNGQAKIALDSFNAAVRIAKSSGSAMKDCK